MFSHPFDKYNIYIYIFILYTYNDNNEDDSIVGTTDATFYQLIKYWYFLGDNWPIPVQYQYLTIVQEAASFSYWASLLLNS